MAKYKKRVKLSRRERYIKRKEKIEDELYKPNNKDRLEQYNRDLKINMKITDRTIEYLKSAIKGDYLTKDQKKKVLIKLKKEILIYRELMRRAYSLHYLYLEKSE